MITAVGNTASRHDSQAVKLQVASMDDEYRDEPVSKCLWQWGKTLTAEKDLELVLGSTRNLPLKYWKTRFFFFGARDSDLLLLSSGQFPMKLVIDKIHPVFALRALPDKAGFKVCPCSSKQMGRSVRFVAEGCRLEHTGHQMDRNSYLVESVEVNIPRSIAHELRFKGRVPEACLKVVKRKN